GLFHFIGNGGKLSLLPWASRVFREGMTWSYEVSRGTKPSQVEKAYSQWGPWYDVMRFAFWKNESLFAKVSMDFSQENWGSSAPTMPWKWDRERPYLVWQSEKAFLLTGNVKGLSLTNEGMLVEVDRDSMWGAIALCTLDDTSWRQTKKILVVMVGKGENTAMKWNSTRTSVGDKWGRLPYRLYQPSWRLYLPGFRAFLLDERGVKTREVFASDGWFVFGKETTPWIVLERK
ncbi:MAG: hypothetical protein ACK4HQ_05610, partial [Brevinematales bacterium]